MFFNTKNSAVNNLDASYFFLVDAFYREVNFPETCESDLEALKTKYDDFFARKEYGKSIETALKIVVYYTPIGFLFYIESKLASLKGQLRDEEIIDQESFNLLIVIFLSTSILEGLADLQTFKDHLVQLNNNNTYSQGCLTQMKEELLTLCKIPCEKIEEAQSVAEDLFERYRERVDNKPLLSL